METARSKMQVNDDCEVWPDNWRSWVFFTGVQTQWLFKPSGGYTGLNYSAIESAMNMQGIKAMHKKRIFRDLRIIEFTVLDTLKEKNK